MNVMMQQLVESAVETYAAATGNGIGIQDALKSGRRLTKLENVLLQLILKDVAEALVHHANVRKFYG